MVVEINNILDIPPLSADTLPMGRKSVSSPLEELGSSEEDREPLRKKKNEQ
jgi:hypothetical protein